MLNDAALDALYGIEIPCMRLAQDMEDAYVRIFNPPECPCVVQFRRNFLQHRQCAVDLVVPGKCLDYCRDERWRRFIWTLTFAQLAKVVDILGDETAVDMVNLHDPE